MNKLNRAVIIISRIAEVFMWVGCGLSAVITALSAAGKLDPAGRKNGFEHGVLLCRFSLQTPLAYTTKP